MQLAEFGALEDVEVLEAMADTEALEDFAATAESTKYGTIWEGVDPLTQVRVSRTLGCK